MQEKIIFGGYTKRGGKGIYQATLDTEAGKLNTPEPYITNIQGPTYLALAGQKYLYAVTADSNQGGVTGFDISAKNPRQINQVLTAGSSPAYVAVDIKRNLLYSGNYHTGRIYVDQIKADGTLVQTDCVEQKGDGPRPEQDSSHIHYTNCTPDGRLVTINLGADTVTTYEISAESKLTNPVIFHETPGFGPRHLVFHPKLPIAYLVGELSSQVDVLRYNASAGTFSSIQTISTIPSTWEEHNGAAAVRISNDGKFLYVSNRGHNSIVTCSIDVGGTLALINFTSTFGDFPRDFAIDPTGLYVVVANQNSDNATLYLRDPVNGRLTPNQINIRLPEGVCVLFI